MNEKQSSPNKLADSAFSSPKNSKMDQLDTSKLFPASLVAPSVSAGSSNDNNDS